MARAGIRAILEEALNIEIVEEAEDSAEVQEMANELRPDVLLLDLRMPGPRPSETVAWARARCLETTVLVLTAHDVDAYLAAMVTAGAAGFVVKDEAPETIVAAVRAVARRERPWTAEQFARAWRWREEVQERWEHLTEREREVLSLIAVGGSNKGIAHEMGISEKTVEYHVTNILGKLGVGSRSEAIVWVKDSGLSVGASDPREIPR